MKNLKNKDLKEFFKQVFLLTQFIKFALLKWQVNREILKEIYWEF